MGYRHGLATVAAAAGLVAAGACAAWALHHGFYGTAAVEALAAIWLTALVWGAAVRPRDAAAARSTVDHRGDEPIVLRALLDQAPGALLAVEEGRVRALNRAARTMFATDDRVLPPPAALLDPGATRLRHGARQWRIDRADVRDLGPSRAIVALVDVEAEEHAAEARATRELLRVLGHEVMNALAPIASLAETALGVLDTPERRDRLLPEILATLARRTDGLRRFTEAYRQVARLPEPRIAPLRVADLFADVARLFDGEWQGRATLALADPQVAQASLDRDQITQALLALLRNGVEAALASGGSPIVRMVATGGAGRLTFAVVDEGAGVDPAQRASIFVPFFTTKPGGNGIGLVAARQIAQAHGGDAILRPGRPTTFELSIPQ